VLPDGRFVVSAGATNAGEQVHVWVHSTPVMIGTVTLNASGAATVPLPAGIAPGAHRVVLQALDGSLIGWSAITVMAVGAVNEQLASSGFDPTGWIVLAALLLFGGAVLLRARRRLTAMRHGAA